VPSIEEAMTTEPVDRAPREDLYLVVRVSAQAEDGEYFERAIVYASSRDAAVAVVSAYIDLSNEAVERERTDEENAELDADEEESEPIVYDRESLEVILLASDVTRPEDPLLYDADDILVFETAWDEDLD
jgi:hypothetical protein